jgi:alpha-2-macroglobulin
MPPLNLENRLRYLIRYPYGCVEQTTSSVFPQLYIGEVMELDKHTKDRIEENIKAGIKRLRGFQHSNGGFGYWPGANQIDDWSSNYVGHFITEAERMGYSLPIGMKNQWIGYQQEAANNWNGYSTHYHRNDFTQAYRLYTLALANEPDLGAMNRLKEYDKISLMSKYYLALAYAISGNKVAAKDLLVNASRDVNDYKELSYTYGSGDRDRAIILETLLQLEMIDEAMPLIQHLSDRLGNQHWMSTQTTAFCLRAMAKTAAIFKKSLGEFKYAYKLNNNKALDVMSTTLVNKHILKLDQADSLASIEVKNTSEVPFYVNLSVEGLPVKPDMESIQKNLEMRVVYKDLDDNTISIDQIGQGTDFKVEITVKNPGIMAIDYKEMALATLFPSGWEIHNTRLYGGGETHLVDQPTYQDIRDDRVYTFFDLRRHESKTFVILLNAAYLGKFVMPAIQCQAMYDNEIQARIPGKTVEVVLRK